MTDEKKGVVKPIQFIPIVLFIASIPIYMITKSAVLTNSGSMFLRQLDDLLGMIMLTPIAGLPIGITGLTKHWNKALSIIDIVIGVIFVIALIVLVIMFFLMLGAIAHTH